MVAKWFLIMFVAAPIPNQADPWFSASVMRQSFDSYQTCMHEAETNSNVSYKTAGNPDPTIVPGVMCLQGFAKVDDMPKSGEAK